MSHQTLIRVLRPLPMRAPPPQHPNRTSFISSRELDPSSWKVFREAGNSNGLGTMVWIRSGIVRRFTWMHSCTRALHLHFAFSFAWWISDWSLLQHSHMLTATPFFDAHPKIVNPLEIQPLTVGSLVGPLSSPSFRQGPGGIFLFSTCQQLKFIAMGYEPSPVCPGCHQSFPVVTRSIPVCQMANASVKY